MLLTMTADRFMSFSADPAMDKQIYDLTVGNIRFLSALSAATALIVSWRLRGAAVFAGASDAAAAGRTSGRRSSGCRWSGMGWAQWRGQTPTWRGDFLDQRRQVPADETAVFVAAAGGGR